MTYFISGWSATVPEKSTYGCNMLLKCGVKGSENHVKPNSFIMREDVIIPIVFFAALFGIIYVFVTARNKERMSMIEKGINPKDFLQSTGPNVYGILKWALLLVGLGLGLFIGSLLETYTEIQEEPAYFASALFFGGMGLVLAFLIQKRAEGQP